MFFTQAAKPVFEAVYDRLLNHGCRKDEFALTDVVGLPEFADFFEVLDYSYNLGTTDFELRYQLAEKPIRVVHFHLGRREHLDVFVRGANSLRVVPVDERFASLLARHGLLSGLQERGALVNDPAATRARMPRYGSTGGLAAGLRTISKLFSR